MKVTGFSFIRNAVTYQYPIEEALRSILPLCDEVVVAVGHSDDNTRELVAALDPKIRIIDTVWDDSQKEGGRVLALETDKALRAIGADSDWCIYIQGDEVMHEDGHAEVRAAMERWKDDKGVDGLLFRYRHFYGSFDYLGASSGWYRNEIRVVKNDKNIYSYRDAQGFRKGKNEKLRVKPLNAYIHHYGWVREPEVMEKKKGDFERQFYGAEAKVYTGTYDYGQVDALEKFTGTHPAVMQAWIRRMNWKFDYDLSYNKFTLKDRLKNLLEKLTGRRFFDYKNYIVV
ncbi:glycosyltransferase family 2 protein [Paraflavisolibacter sp. H34]|uniref:glycosyltransferase family 2 protein n=1 Tax=Huijunlia imazamoxiresistens TaxID=3127457 RepID=UPI00301AFE46